MYVIKTITKTAQMWDRNNAAERKCRLLVSEKIKLQFTGFLHNSGIFNIVCQEVVIDTMAKLQVNKREFYQSEGLKLNSKY